jgi:hypothetical protein
MEKQRGRERNMGKRRVKIRDVKDKGRDNRNNFPHYL